MFNIIGIAKLGGVCNDRYMYVVYNRCRRVDICE